MIEWERRMKLRILLEQGLAQSEIAEQLGLSRRTIYRWVQSGELDRDVTDPPRYGPRTPRERKLDPYRPFLEDRLGEFPELTGTRLFREIRAQGYTGGITQLRDYLQELRPRVEPDPVVRFETPPGRQGQVDFARFRLPWGIRYALLVVLGHSRLLWFQFFPRQDFLGLLGGLEQAFRFFGGVPQELLFDQMRSVVLRDLRAEGGPLVENPEFLRFAAHWGFRPRACRPYRARTKGKVERPIRYIRQDFFYGRDFLNDEDLNAQALHWLDAVANVRIHGTTGQAPRARFLEEQDALRPLALRPYRSLVLEPPPGHPPARHTAILPRVPVERRPLRVYSLIAAGEGA